VAKARNRESILANLEELSFIESMSTRFEIPPKLVVYAMGGAAVILIAILCWMALSSSGVSSSEPLRPQSSTTLEHPPTEFSNATSSIVADTPVATHTQSCVVYVTGAVINPGLYTLAGNGRVGDAVQAAGGFTPDAAAAVVNLAQPLSDGIQIHIPSLSEVERDAPAPGATPSSSSSNSSNSTSSGTEASTLVNINTADSTTLQTLSGIGPATAQKIIDYRTSNGPFSSKEELKQVSGIGEKKYAAIEAKITV